MMTNKDEIVPECVDFISNSLKYNSHDFEEMYLGTDNSTGLHPEVSILQCKKCNKKKVRILVEMEWTSRSARWFEGEISEDELKLLTPENAIPYLGSLSVIIYGGSYFNGMVRQGNGSIITLELDL